MEQLAGDGRWTCLDLSGNVCLENLIDIDREAMDNYDDWKQTTCHEVGHSVGLHHQTWDCLGTAHNGSQFQKWADHHVFHVNQDR